MWTIILQWLKDPTVQGLLLSPLIGAVMGAVLTLLIQRPPPSERPPPESVRETKIVFVREVRAERKGEDDSSLLLGLAVAAALALTWAYARYAMLGVQLWVSFTLTFLAFNLTAALTAAMKREFAADWIAYILIPLCALFASLWLAKLAIDGIIPNAAAVAAKHGAVQFFLNVLNHEQRTWLLTQGLGVLVGVVATLVAAGRLTYYVALSNQRGFGWWASLWRVIARTTRGFGNTGGLVVGCLLYLSSALLLSGRAYVWMAGRTGV